LPLRQVRDVAKYKHQEWLRQMGLIVIKGGKLKNG